MIHVRLSADDLRSYRTSDGEPACNEGVARFVAVLGERGIDCEWTAVHGWVALATFGPDYRWAAAAGLVPDLAGAYLAGANLAGADLAGANLARADLAGAYLAGANLAGANLGTRERPAWLTEQWIVVNGYVARRES